MTTLATMTERQSWEEFEHSASIQPLNPRATTAGDSVATAATGFEGSFRLQSFNRFGSMERAPKVCLFVCISSSRDRLKFETPFLKFSNENADLAPLRPYCGWTANGGGRCEWGWFRFK